MIYLRYVLCSFVTVVITALSKVCFNWVVAAFADEGGNLPRYLSWFQTFDATLDEGMYSRRRELKEGTNDDWADFDPYPVDSFGRYMNRAKWLQRNTGYGFDYYLLGMPFVPAEWTVRRFEDTAVRTLFIATGPGFNLYYYGRFGMVKFGWKAWNYYDPRTGMWKTSSWGPEWRAPIAFSITPFKRK